MIVTSTDEVRAAIKAGLDILRPYQRRALGIDPDQARDWLTEDLVRRVTERSKGLHVFGQIQN